MSRIPKQENAFRVRQSPGPEMAFYNTQPADKLWDCLWHFHISGLFSPRPLPRALIKKLGKEIVNSLLSSWWALNMQEKALSVSLSSSNGSLGIAIKQFFPDRLLMSSSFFVVTQMRTLNNHFPRFSFSFRLPLWVINDGFAALFTRRAIFD